MHKTEATDWMNVLDVATALGVSDATVRRWADAGKLPPPHRFSRRVLRWKREEIEQFIAAAKNQ